MTSWFKAPLPWVAATALMLSALTGCSVPESPVETQEPVENVAIEVEEPVVPAEEIEPAEQKAEEEAVPEKSKTKEKEPADDRESVIQRAYEKLDISEDFRESFVHGDKSAKYQKYIVLHDTEGDGDASSVIDWWDSNGNLVAAHFVVNKDGSIVQCAPLDTIVHHAGFGDTGHNEKYGTEDESRDDKLGTQPIGDWASDYGMNSYSVGIEMVHVGGSGDYPEAQLDALDDLIAYIDAYYGFESEIIDHKAWRSGNSDTSPEFSDYLDNYKTQRTHN